MTSVARSRLRIVAAPPRPLGIVLLLHGGREYGLGPVRAHQLAVLRMIPIAGRVVRSGGGRLVVARLQHGVRGWNGDLRSPVVEAERAIDRLRQRFGPTLPIALIGHSMGGRTAMAVAGARGVRTVVGLAPWLPNGEPVPHLAGRQVLIVHGSADRTTDPRESQRFASAATPIARVSVVDVRGEGHALLRRRSVVEGLTADYVRATLLDPTAVEPGPESETSPAANLLQRVLAGESPVVI